MEIIKTYQLTIQNLSNGDVVSCSRVTNKFNGSVLVSAEWEDESISLEMRETLLFALVDGGQLEGTFGYDFNGEMLWELEHYKFEFEEG